MSTGESVNTVEVLGQGNPLRRPALRLILGGRSPADEDVERRLRILESALAGQGMNLDLLVGGFHAGRLTAAAMAVESPGRHAIVHLSPSAVSPVSPHLSQPMLRTLQAEAWKRDLVLLQVMALPGESELERVIAASGFRFLAELIYAERPRGAPVPTHVASLPLEYVTYTPARHALFLDALEQTYAESLDCAGLSGVRHTEDVLAGHRATGRHDPSLWFVAQRAGAAAGVLLLSTLRDRKIMEVVYMGVAQAFRRCGVAHALMQKCHEVVGARGHYATTLAVDSVNTPARALYRRWGFLETGRRRAWIALRPG